MEVTPHDLTFHAEMLSGRNIVDCKRYLLENGLCSIRYKKGVVYKREDFDINAIPDYQELLLWNEDLSSSSENYKYTIGYPVNGDLKTQALVNWTHVMIL